MAVPEPPSDPSVENLAALDEILQVMYWLRGERLADAVSAGDLARWIGMSREAIGPLLERLAGSGLVQQVEGSRYALTAAGAREGGRRFADEFADLTRPGHYECTDPDCECQRTGNPADCVYRHA
jgi:DNA-binding transcriptional ArsR family regulator